MLIYQFSIIKIDKINLLHFVIKNCLNDINVAKKIFRNIYKKSIDIYKENGEAKNEK